MDLVAFGCGRPHPQGVDQRRSTAQLLRASGMRLKTSGSNAGGLAAGVGGVSVQRGGRRGWRSSAAQEGPLACQHHDGRRPGVVPIGWRAGKAASPPNGCGGPTLTALPLSAGRSGLGRFGNLESPGPTAAGGQAPSVLGGGGRAPARSRGARGSGGWEAGATGTARRIAPPPQRRSWGNSTWQPGAT